MAKVRILVVDDSVSIRTSMSFILEQQGYEVILAEDGQDGLKKAALGQCALVITDVNMPIMDGLTFVREMRKTTAYKFVPIIVLTTENQASKMKEGQDAGATGWIVKPFSADKLIAIVKKILG